MSGPANAVMGEQDAPTAMPETTVPDEALDEEKKMAKFSKSAEYQRLEKFMRDRIRFYQRYLPNGSLVEGDSKDNHLKINIPEGMTPDMMNVYWMAACLVTKEFGNVLAAYEQARETVKNAGREN